jgi:5-methyltetrahydrofolate--homocysteine methyltransferase
MSNDREVIYDPLHELMARFENVKAVDTSVDPFEGLSVEDSLKKHIIDGVKKNLERRLEAGLQQYEPLQIINEILLDGMKTVGELFGAGKMQLPFVLQSAEVMKAAVRFLEPLMEKVEGTEKGSILLATVSGDVHDIGKNLVDIILSNNGYRVVNIGIKQPINTILEKCREHQCQVIGMSGLLVKSTVIMRENLQELNAVGLSEIPVILGGAALTRTYVEKDLREVYDGRVFYGRDAFEGLYTLDKIMAIKRDGVVDPDFGRIPSGRVLPDRNKAEREEVELPHRSPDVATDNPVQPGLRISTLHPKSIGIFGINIRTKYNTIQAGCGASTAPIHTIPVAKV